MSDLVENLEFWMTNLPERLTSVPIVHLAIPGSHDSTTYAIDKKSKISPDARNPIQYLKFLEPILRPIMIKWSKTQTVDIMEQLRGGIRYFDLRIAWNPTNLTFNFVHNLYSEEVTPIFEQINDFLKTHSREVVILDCQHFYDMNSGDHRRLFSLFVSIFGTKILPYSVKMTHINLNYMRERQSQVLIIYRADEAIIEELLWPSSAFPTPWPDTVDIPQLIQYLNAGLKTRDYSYGYVSQCVLTPTVWFSLRHLFGSLKSECVLPLENSKYDWLLSHKPGFGGVNVIISDFIEFEDYKFPREVINLNLKLLECINPNTKG